MSAGAQLPGLHLLRRAPRGGPAQPDASLVAAAAEAEVRARYKAQLPSPPELGPLELEALADDVQRRLRAQGLAPVERGRLLKVIKEAWDWLWKSGGKGGKGGGAGGAAGGGPITKYPNPGPGLGWRW